MSAAPNLQPTMPEGLSTREAAPLFGVSETTLRRAMKKAEHEQPHATIVEGECRGIGFHAWRDARLPRRPWRIVLVDVAAPQGFTLSPFEVKSADNRIRDLRSAIRTNFEAYANLPEIDFTAPGEPEKSRRWRWKFWSRAK
jgi:hypothetical protein